MLYVVATPIGNLGDMSPRAIDVLRSVGLIAAEDTRHTLKLLNHFDIRTPLTSYHEHNEQQKAERLVTRMVEEGLSVALVTDAGTPAISDPGAIFVRQAAQAGIEVIAVPGPTAFAAALSISGFTRPQFTFYGFPPRDRKALFAFLETMKGQAQLAVLHESPHRVAALLKAVLDCLGDVELSLSCDLSKLHEKTLRGSATEVLEAFLANEKAEKGEYVLVMDLGSLPADQVEPVQDISLEARLLDLMLQGEDLRTAQQKLQEQGIRKNLVYAAALRLKGLLKEEGQEKCL
jgi:16S rRNA (cytidine1402-2'-O)-methyltransferase